MFQDPSKLDFVPALEAAFGDILAELKGLDESDFVASPDSLTTVSGGYDETGWLCFDLHGGAGSEANRGRCPRAARACEAVPGMLSAGFSLLRPGTHLYPHRGEMSGVLRCHLPILVPSGDLGLCGGGETRVWHAGRCLVFDDTFEHEAWNRGDGDRVVLLLTFQESSVSSC